MKFSKLHGAGNDFSLFDGIHQELPEFGPLAKAVCDRHFGTGGDGIMAALPSKIADIRMVYYNSDGSMGEMCGNGIRCFSKFVYEKGLVTKPLFEVETAAGIKKITLALDEENKVQKISVGMGRPAFAAGEVPTTLTGDPVLLEPLQIGEQLVMISAIRMGVPHSVIVLEDLEKVDIEGIGAKIEGNQAFPEKVNVNFMQVMDRGHIKVKTFERGAGHTLACGTGCCSCVIVGHKLGLLDQQVEVQAEGGLLTISLSDDYDVTMEGEAQFICDGEYSQWVIDRIREKSQRKQACLRKKQGLA
ncbi:MAG: diaminopimelate epimerase [Peptococcaceae bacterium]|nr:diaminopimelate epimerase [Peptococcaceae bacterium]